MEKLQKGKGLINRKRYKEVKKYDRAQLEEFVMDLYRGAYKDGLEAGREGGEVAGLLLSLENGECKGVGKATVDKIRVFVEEEGAGNCTH